MWSEVWHWVHNGGSSLREDPGSAFGYCNGGGESVCPRRWLVPCPSSFVASVGSGSDPGPKFRVASHSARKRWETVSSSGSSVGV